MSSVRKQAKQVLRHLPIRPSKGNVVDHIHHRVLKGQPAVVCQEVVRHLIYTEQVDFEGSADRPTALFLK